MKKYITIAIVTLIVLMSIQIVVQDRKIERLTDEVERYRNNTETLLSDVQTYKVRDSLNAAKVQSLELTQKEFEKYRTDDAALIRELKTKNRDLTAVNDAQAQTIIDLRAVPKDTVVIRDSIPIPAVSVKCGDEWYDFRGLLTESEFTGTLENRESLLLSETVRYKKFLFWKTKKILDRETEVVSRNPHTKIVNVESIVIEK